MDENNYIEALKSTLIKQNLFLERDPSNVWNNSYATNTTLKKNMQRP